MVMDDESREAHNLADRLLSLTSAFAQSRLEYNSPSTYYGRNGHDRQQLIMFWADNFTEAEYIGFVDTDTFFVAPVDRADLFEGQKPVIIGMYGMDRKKLWRKVPRSTAYTLKQPEVLRCMFYFPVIIRSRHLRQLREFIYETHGQNMNDFFQSLKQRPYSQFNIMCNYLWYHHRDEYAWHVQDSVTHLPGRPSLGQVGSKEVAGITEAMLRPKPRVSIHTTYHFNRWGKIYPHLLREILAAGFCYDALATNSSVGITWCR